MAFNRGNEETSSPAHEQDLPDGWTLAHLEDICAPPQYGWTTSAVQNGHGLKLLRTTDISGGAVDWSKVPGCRDEPENPEKYLLSPGDIVVSRAGSVGVSYLIKHSPPAIFASYLIRVRPLAPISSEFIAYFFHSRQYWDAIAEETSGITIPNVNASKLKRLLIPLPPLDEQKRIVAKVEELLARVYATRERLAKVPVILKRFRQAVLAAACSGRLSEDWRQAHNSVGRRKVAQPVFVHDGDLPELPENWAWITIEKLASGLPRSIQSGPFGSNLLHSEFKDVGILAIGIDNVTAGKFSMGMEHRIRQEKYKELEKYTARPLDVLVTVMATVGRCCVVPENLETAIITKHVYRITANQELIKPYFLMYALLGDPTVQNQIQNQIIGQTRPGINGKILRRISIPTPPVPEQEEIIRRIEALFKLGDKIETRVATATQRTERVSQAILAKAYRGELVPTEAELARHDGRSYEPASVLLARIRTEQNTSAVKGRKIGTEAINKEKSTGA